jgi:hypothetical protein
MMGVLLLAGPLFSQTATGRIAGTVRDQTGGAIVGAAVVVTDVARGLTRNLTTDEAGAYLAPQLIAGTYTVRVSFTGFQAWERTNIPLGVGGDVVIDAILLPGAQTQTVTITEELPLMNTTSSTLGATLTNETIADLPVSGRNYAALLDLRPGTVTQLGNENGGGGTTSVNGLRGELSNETTIEGLHGLNPGGGVSNSPFLRGDSSTMLPTDAIQEFSQQTNVKAENSFRPGGTVNIGIKSGTNAIHGTMFGYFREAEIFDARNFFNVKSTQPEVNGSMQQVGGTIGGPVMQDKLFYFLAYEHQRYQHGNSSSASVAFTDPAMLDCTGSGAGYSCAPGTSPSQTVGGIAADASNHLILACLGIRSAIAAGGPTNAGVALSPQSLSMVSLDSNCEQGPNYPFTTVTPAGFPNGVPWFVPHGASDHGAVNGASGINTYFPNAQTTNRSHNAVAKIDYTFNERNSLNVFWFGANGLLIGESSKLDPVWYARVRVKPMMLAATWTWIPNSSWANTFRAGYAQENRYFRGVDATLGLTAAELGLPTGVQIFQAVDGANENQGYPQSFAVSGFATIGSRNSEPRGPHRTPEISDAISYLRGNHAFRMGGSYFSQVQDGGTWAATRGNFTFGEGASGNNRASGLAAFLVGQNKIPVSVSGINLNVTDQPNSQGLQSASLFYGNPDSHMRRQLWSLFIQDDWRIRPALTLNLGLRYDIATVPHDRDYILGTFDPSVGIVQEGVQISAIHRGDHNDISPRVGLAWDVRGNGRTVLRAAGSMIYAPVGLGVFAEIGNAPGLAGAQTNWIIGCTTALSSTTQVPAGASSNCPGAFVKPGGNRDVGIVNWDRGSNTIQGVVVWDAPPGGTIFPSGAALNCSKDIRLRDGVTTPTSPAVAGRVGAGCDVVAVDRTLRTPYVETWTLSIQHAITNNVVVDVAYVGNHGTMLIGRIDYNQPAVSSWTPARIASCISSKTNGTCNGNSSAQNADELAARPFVTQFPYLNVITGTGNYFTSNYNALQTTLTARNFHGLSSVLGYTYGRALEISSDNTTTASDTYNIALDYGNGRNDLKHRMTLSTVYQVPGVMGYFGLLNGWRLNSVLRWQSGSHWAPGNTNDFAGIGTRGSNNTSRWDFYGDPSDFEVDYRCVGGYTSCADHADFHPAGTTGLALDPQTGAAYASSADATADLAINDSICQAAANGDPGKLATLQVYGCWTQGGSALTPPPPGRFGTQQRNIFNAPEYFGLDFSVTKRHQITERYSAEFRVETFNILNHPAFTNPSSGLGCANVGSCTFGRVSNTPNVGATNPLLGSGGQRRMMFGVKFIF